MPLITLNASGGMSLPIVEPLNPGARYLFWFYGDAVTAGELQLDELSPLLVPVPFYSEVAGSSRVVFDFAVANGGRMEFTAATEKLNIYIANGTAENAGNVVGYGLTRVAR
jgi:hypothetical protein